MIKNLEETLEMKGMTSKLFLRRKLAEYNEKYELIDRKIQIVRSEEEKINNILLSMPMSFEPLETLRYEFVKDRLLGEEEKRKRSTEPKAKAENFAFSCYTCGEPGHKRIECRQNNYNK